jgi:crotonobetainyl-CoA:carnitine CoA-transferase CaiB-like acyl-CoA transferase
MAETALDGVRVVDISEGVAGGYCTKLFAGLGADVVKVERPGVGDGIRRAGPFVDDVPHIETSLLHLHLATGKRSLTLDVRTRSGTAILRALLKRADVLVAGYDGLTTIADVEQSFPELIVTSVTPWGSDGPRARWRRSEIVTMAASGYLSLNGDPDREPVKPYGDQAQYQAGLHAALGTLAALRAREQQHAGGQRVDVSAQEAAGFLTAGALQRQVLMRRPQVRCGPRPAGFAPNRLYPSTIRPCADGHVHVHCHNRFPELISVLMQEPRLATPEVLSEPLGHADEIDALMDAWLAKRTRAEAVAEAQELRIPMTEVFTPAEVVDDVLGQHAARDAFACVEHPVVGTVTQPAAPIVMRATPWRVARAPLLGEHTGEVLCGELGLSTRELARLAAAGVV